MMFQGTDCPYGRCMQRLYFYRCGGVLMIAIPLFIAGTCPNETKSGNDQAATAEVSILSKGCEIRTSPSFLVFFS